MFESFNSILGKIDDFVWGLPLIILILAVGIFLTVRLKGVQFTNLGRAFRCIIKNERSGEHGEVSSFGALCTSLSATIGTGNIVGVATALVAGGPGALFWMWLAALLGTATKYAECLLAVKYRKVDADGHIVGGPFYYIETGMGRQWKWLAKIFAFFGVGVGLAAHGAAGNGRGGRELARAIVCHGNGHRALGGVVGIARGAAIFLANGIAVGLAGICLRKRNVTTAEDIDGYRRAVCGSWRHECVVAL